MAPANPVPSSPAPVLPQFGDRMILDYITHQRRLFPALAATYALHLGMLRLKAVLMQVSSPPWQRLQGASAAGRRCRLPALLCCGALPPPSLLPRHRRL